MKKFLCAFLTVAMLITIVCPVMATTDIAIGDTQASTIIELFKDYMPTEPMKRTKIWKTFKAFMLDGTNGIDTVIRAVNDPSILPSTPNDIDFKNVMNIISSQLVDKDALIFALNVYKAVPIEKRRASLNAFGSDADSIINEVIKTPLSLDATQLAAANAIYERHVHADVRTEYADEHQGLGIANFLQLATAFKGQFKMTNGTDDEFVLSSYSEDFATSLASFISVDSVNGISVSTSPNAKAEGFDIISGLVAMFNDFTDDIDDLKIVLAHTDIDLYGENLTVATRPTVGTSDITGGFGGGSPYLPDKEEPVKPEEPDKPIVNDSDFEISTPQAAEDAPSFPDTVDHWSEDYVRNLASRGIILGDDDGNFRPDMGVTRQEIAVMLVRGLGLEAKAAEYANKNSGFGDHDIIADWALGAVNLLVDMGIYTGYDDGEFKPEKTILRQELIAVVMRYADNTKPGLTNDYTDSHEIHGYAYDFVAHASDLGIISGYPDGSFAPLNNITRAEAAKVLYGVFEYYEFLTEKR